MYGAESTADKLRRHGYGPGTKPERVPDMLTRAVSCRARQGGASRQLRAPKRNPMRDGRSRQRRREQKAEEKGDCQTINTRHVQTVRLYHERPVSIDVMSRRELAHRLAKWLNWMDFTVRDRLTVGRLTLDQLV